MAAFVSVETTVNGFFNDNGLLLAPGIHDLTFYPRVQTTQDELRESIHITSLYEAGGFAQQ